LYRADNYVPLAKVTEKKADGNLVKAANTIMKGHLWLEEPYMHCGCGASDVYPNEVSPVMANLHISRASGEPELNSSVDLAAKARFDKALKHPDVVRLQQGKLIPYPALFTSADTNGEKDCGDHPRTTAMMPDNIGGKFGTHLTHYDLVLKPVLDAIADPGQDKPIMIYLADQEGAWIIERMSGGALPHAEEIKWIILSYAMFHSQKNLIETVVYSDQGIANFWGAALGELWNEYKYRAVKTLCTKDVLKRWATISSLTTFITENVVVEAGTDIPKGKDALVKFAFDRGVRATANKIYTLVVGAVVGAAVAAASDADADADGDEEGEGDEEGDGEVVDPEELLGDSDAANAAQVGRAAVIAEDDGEGEENAAENEAESLAKRARPSDDSTKNPHYTPTKERGAKSLSYSRIKFDVRMTFMMWELHHKYELLYHGSQMAGFDDAVAGVGDVAASAGWSKDFVARVEKGQEDECGTLPFDVNTKPPHVPFDIEEAVEHLKGACKGFWPAWYHFDFVLRLCVEPYEELMVTGDPLKLWNSLLPRMCLLIAAEREKVARVDAGFLARLLYWRDLFGTDGGEGTRSGGSDPVLPFLARFSKHVHQDVLIEFLNRMVSEMMRRNDVSAADVRKVTLCSKAKRELKASLFAATGSGAAKYRPSVLQLRLQRLWAPQFEVTRLMLSRYLSKQMKQRVTPTNDAFDKQTVRMAVPDVINNLIPSKRKKEGDRTPAFRGITHFLDTMVLKVAETRRGAADRKMFKREILSLLVELKVVMQPMMNKRAATLVSLWDDQWNVTDKQSWNALDAALKAARAVYATAPELAKVRRAAKKRQRSTTKS